MQFHLHRWGLTPHGAGPHGKRNGACRFRREKLVLLALWAQNQEPQGCTCAHTTTTPMPGSLTPVQLAVRAAGRSPRVLSRRGLSMLASSAPVSRCTARTPAAAVSAPALAQRRTLATTGDDAFSAAHVAGEARKHAYRLVVVGGGTAGQAVAKEAAKSGFFPSEGAADILVVDPAEFHDYQPGWTLVGGGVRTREEGRRSMQELTVTPAVQGKSAAIDYLADSVATFAPDANEIKTRDGRTITYEQLVVAPGLKTKWNAIEGLTDALAEPKQSGVVSIYGYNTVPHVFPAIEALTKGQAIFTQPAGVIKCAGAPQKIMWMALDHWKRAGQFSPSDPTKGVKVSFLDGMPTMFSVPKYSAVLDTLRKEREVEGLFSTNLVKIDSDKRVATFTTPDGGKLERAYDLLHVSPPMGPLEFIQNSPIAAKDGGFVDVDQGTTQHKKYKNVWSLGDSSSLPTSKTTAAITAQAPVTVANMLFTMANPSAADLPAAYDGYTSCPLITEYGKVLLAEFKYGGQPKESFAKFGIDQAQPMRAFWYLKKEFFPRVYYSSMVNGNWAGAKGWLNPKTLAPQTRGLHTSARPSLGSVFQGQRRSFSTSPVAPRHRHVRPVRRSRDPLEEDKNAAWSRLPTGESFIVRPPPSVEQPESTTMVLSPILDGKDPKTGTADSVGAAHLPPPTRPERPIEEPVVDPRRTPLTAADIISIQRLRASDPIKFNVYTIARMYGVKPLWVRMVAPANPSVRGHAASMAEEKRKRWTIGQRVTRAERIERRKLW